MAIVYRKEKWRPLLSAKMARPLILPLQQTDICIATQKKKYYEWLQFIGFMSLWL